MRDAVDEMTHYREFDYLVINDDFEVALGDLRSIIRGRRMLRERQRAAHAEMIASLLV